MNTNHKYLISVPDLLVTDLLTFKEWVYANPVAQTRSCFPKYSGMQ